MKRSVNFTGSRANVARRAAQDPVARGFLEALGQRDALLGALRAIHTGLDPNVGGPTITRDEILAISSAAIAKATGGGS